jgi:glycosyltransferase involved in cell wall biosynthesis
VEIQQATPARLTPLASPAVVSGAQATFYELTVENLSGEDWTLGGPHPLHLSYHWLSERGDPVIYDGVRSPLPGLVPTGGSCRARLRVHPPALPGRYILAIDLVREGVSWFGLDCRFSVELTPVTQPRAVLINRNCVARDAIGNNIVRKLRLLRKWGYAPLLLVHDFDRRLPIDEQALMVEVDLDRMLDPPPDILWAAQHFWHAGLYIFDYPEYYPLVDLIRMTPGGTVIFDYHGVTPPELWSSALSRENLELGVRNLRLADYADLAIAHSDYTRQELIATGVIAPERVAVMPYAVSFDAFHPAIDKSYAPPNALHPPVPAPQYESGNHYSPSPTVGEGAGRWGTVPPGDGPILLYVGRMAGNKRIDTLIRMAALVQKRYPNVRLLLVGDDQSPAYAEVVGAAHELIDALGLANNVAFTGQAPDEELVALYQSADVFVTASLHEGFCIPAIEAMACGVPIVAAAAAALPSTVGDAGLLFEPENAEMCAAQVIALLDSKSGRGHEEGQAHPTNPTYIEGF